MSKKIGVRKDWAAQVRAAEISGGQEHKEVKPITERSDVQVVQMPVTASGKPRFTSRMDGSAGGERQRPSFG